MPPETRERKRESAISIVSTLFPPPGLLAAACWRFNDARSILTRLMPVGLLLTRIRTQREAGDALDRENVTRTTYITPPPRPPPPSFVPFSQQLRGVLRWVFGASSCSQEPPTGAAMPPPPSCLCAPMHIYWYVRPKDRLGAGERHRGEAGDGGPREGGCAGQASGDPSGQDEEVQGGWWVVGGGCCMPLATSVSLFCLSIVVSPSLFAATNTSMCFLRGSILLMHGSRITGLN